MKELSAKQPQQGYVLMLDKKKLRRAGVSAFLKSWSDSCGLTVIDAEALTAEQDPKYCRLAILNIGGSAINDPECKLSLEQIRAVMQDVPIVIISDRDEMEEVVAAFQAGARGFFISTIEPNIALLALTFILGGGWFYPPSALLRPFQKNGNGHGEASYKESMMDDGETREGQRLTERQLEVHELLRQGKSNKMIARTLNMQESTVKVHVRHIMRKLGVANRTQAALCAASNGYAPSFLDDIGSNAASGIAQLSGKPINGSFSHIIQ